jgi:pimeloyl-ACP methyl ester carboxylesterase
MQLKTLTYRSSKIFYRTIGKGRPVVLIHGFAEDGEIWNNQIEFLSAQRALGAGSGGKNDFTLIIPDLPGTGKSELIADMSIEGMADLIKEILTIELSKFPLQGAEGVVIGHSMGGYITLAIAEKYPELISAFGLCHSSAFADNEEKKAARLKSIEFIKSNGAYEFLKTTIPGLFLLGQDGSKPSDSNAAILIEKGKQFTPEALIKYYQAMIARPDRIEVLKTFNGPVLFIIGEHDKAIPFEQSMQQCYLPPQSHVHILRNSAHMGMLEETDKVNAAMLQFLQLAT